ncbi:hypothetical protein GWI33_015554 [Rhynchophorus ferrugineus]|uniref:Uncharacterized protein n=1 Tax=Rhynchophorus ferrugineus TaxID=354439 RepID=A0A834I320_RHYFE|nr:hypothetical protein GWI33_015554 [Rhynchophorus ferrugineus]
MISRNHTLFAEQLSALKTRGDEVEREEKRKKSCIKSSFNSGGVRTEMMRIIAKLSANRDGRAEGGHDGRNAGDKRGDR